MNSAFKPLGIIAILAIIQSPTFAIPGKQPVEKRYKIPASVTEAKNFMASSTPLYFIENKGQVTDQFRNPRPDIQFQLKAASGLNIFIGSGAIHYQFSKNDNPGSLPSMDDLKNHRALSATFTMYRMDVELVGANKKAKVITEQKQNYYENSYIPGAGKNGVITYAYNKITYKDIYPNIDWVLYISNGHLEHEFVVRMGGKASDIKLKYGGAKDLKINADGNLAAATPQGVITEKAPSTYGKDGRQVSSGFVLKGDVVSYHTGNYTGELIIDPTLSWATYYGGSGNDNVNGMVLDASDNVYIGGNTTSTSGIATTGAFETTYGGGPYTGYLAKFNAAGAIQWATYYGGTGYDCFDGVAVDATGNVYAGGFSTSTGMGTSGTYQPDLSGYANCTLVKFNSSGTRLWATYYGNDDDLAQNIVADAAGNVYMSAYVESSSGMATSGAYQSTNAGGWDAVVAKFDNTGNLVWGTYFGGPGGDFGQSIAIDASGNVYLGGATGSSTGIASTGAFQTTYGGGQDAFLAKFTNSGTFQWATYYGGSGSENASGLATDASGNVYLGSSTQSSSGIASTGAYQATLAGSQNGYLVKFNGSGARLWGTYYGGTGNDGISQFTTDESGNIYIGGSASSTSAIATSGAYQATYGGGSSDAFLAEFNTAGSLVYATYFGGSGTDNGTQAIFDGSGNVYFSGGTQSTSGIATSGAYQTALAGGTDAFIAKFSGFPGGITGLSAVCAGSTITLSGTTTGGTWSSASTGIATVGSTTGVVTGVAAGTDIISYLVSGTLATKVITVNPLPSAGSISGTLSVCAGATVTLTDAMPGGDWSSSNMAIANVGSSTGTVTGIAAGTAVISYTVTNSCGSVSATQVVTVNALPSVSAISGASSVCQAASITLTDVTTGGVWSSSNSSATVAGGTVTGVSAGIDTIRYSVTNTCGTTTATKTITINPLPVAGTITGAPDVCVGASLVLVDSSSGGVWSSSNGDATVTGGIVTGVTEGVDTIKYTVTNLCGTAATTKIMTIIPLPATGVITGLSSVCVDAVISLTDATTGGVWGSSNSNASVAGGLVTGATAGADTISYFVTNACGTATATKTITIDPLPNAGAITGAASVCSGASTTLTDVATGGVWTSTNATATVSAGVVSGISTGIDTIIYTVTNVCGTASTSKIITVNPPLSAGTIVGDSIVCTGAAITVADAITGGSWSSSNASATVTGGVVTGINPGMDTIKYTVTNACGTATAAKDITISPLPEAGIINGDSSVCLDSTVILTDTIAGGVWDAINANAAVGSGGAVTGVVAGVDAIVYTVTNVCGAAEAVFPIEILPAGACVASGVHTPSFKAATLNVYPNPNNGSFTLLLSSAVDEGATVSITNMVGVSVKQMKIKSNIATDETLNVAAGVYIISVDAPDGRYEQKLTVY